MFERIDNGLLKHLQEAWEINKARASYYAERTHGKSKLLSLFLVFMEQLTALPALFIDWQAKKFHELGVPMIEKDLVTMNDIKDPSCPPRYQKRATPRQYRQIKAISKQFQSKIRPLLAKNDFNQVANEAYWTLRQIRQLEGSYECHFAMECHLIESIGFGALHASKYARLTEGKSTFLSKFFLQLHIWSLDLSLAFDYQVQKIHAMGVGFLVNDIPDIPFEKEWEYLHGVMNVNC